MELTASAIILQASIYKSFKPYPFAMDIFVETPVRFARRARLGDPLIKEVAEQGKTLYERKT
jgi:hypothetical protein